MHLQNEHILEHTTIWQIMDMSLSVFLEIMSRQWSTFKFPTIYAIRLERSYMKLSNELILFYSFCKHHVLKNIF